MPPSDRLRVALVVPALRVGGVETSLLRLAKAWSRTADVEFVTTHEPGAWSAHALAQGLSVVHVAGRDSALPGSPLHHTLRVAAFLRARRYDAVLLNHAPYAQSAIALLPDRVAVVPVLHNHVEHVYRVGLANAGAWNAAIAVGPRIRREAERLVPGRAVELVPYGVEIPEKIERRPPSEERTFELLFVGRVVDEQKGVFLLPKILRRVLSEGVRARLTIVGDGPDLAPLRERIDAEGVASAVEFTGALSAAEAQRRMVASHVLLVPSNYEGLPVTPLEAQARGLVPIATRLEGITDVSIESGVTGVLFERGDVEAAADAVVHLARSPDEWHAMSVAARARIAEDFSVDSMAAGYARVVDDCLAGRHPPPRRRYGVPPLDPTVFSAHEYLPGWVRKLGRRALALVGRPLG